jgi:hypothetical protein
MTYSLDYVLIEPQQRSEIVFSLAHHRATQLQVLVADARQKSFFEDVLTNSNFSNIQFNTFEQYTTQQQEE